jgi:uracil phosphoribosyltransferase
MINNNLTVVDNPLVKRDLTILRNKETDVREFRNALRRVSYSLAIEVSKLFPFNEITVETPLTETKGIEFAKDIILVPVLRAGLSMVNSFLELLPNAKVGHIGLQRNEETLQPVEYYYKTPRTLSVSKVIVLDPMLATGGSASAAFRFLKKRGASDITLACLISAPEGIQTVSEEHPEIKIITASLDEKLNENGYIVPGLGDAGDRTFGTL